MKNITSKIFVVDSRVEPLLPLTGNRYENAEIWRWGGDNQMPYALAALSRSSTIHRRIINDKADYITGRGFAFDESNKALAAFTESANGSGESLRAVLQRVSLDKMIFGNSFIEIVTDQDRTWLSVYHQDASKCRLAKDKKRVVMNHDWAHYNHRDSVSLPIYPFFDKAEDGTLRSMIHYKDYEPMFENYGLPHYIAGLGVSSIAYKTDRWNISRLDNAFQMSGVMILDGDVETDAEATEIAETAQRKFAGRPGQVMFMVKNKAEGEGSKFIPLKNDQEGDWKALHEQATGDIVVAHSWYRTLSGMNYATGFASERIIHEYNIALNTLIVVEQAELLDPLKQVISEVAGIKCDDMTIINTPPIITKPDYMRVWEARRLDGLDYDPENPAEQIYISQIKNGGTQYAADNT